jgi:xanthine/uracil permease
MLPAQFLISSALIVSGVCTIIHVRRCPTAVP